MIPVRNGQKWDGSIHLQVVDSAGHACKDANIQISLKCDGNMKVQFDFDFDFILSRVRNDGIKCCRFKK